MPERKDMNNADIVAMYVEQKMSTWEIAAIFNICHNSIRRRLIASGVTLRNKSESQKCIKNRKTGPDHHSWKGGTCLDASGYVHIGHLNKRQHRVIAERVLGRSLSPNEVVHHIDGNPSNNSNSNLLICTGPYHSLIHARLRAKLASGNANAVACTHCHSYSDPSIMKCESVKYKQYIHWDCIKLANQKNNERRRKNRILAGLRVYPERVQKLHNLQVKGR